MRELIKITGENRGRILIETSAKDWFEAYKKWEDDTSAPCPMPVGHPIFDDPERFGYATVTH